MIRLALAALLALPAGTFFRAETTGKLIGTSGADHLFAGTGPSRTIGCGGNDEISGGNDDPGDDYHDRLYGDQGPDGECPNASGNDWLHLGPGDIGFGGNGRDNYALHGLRYPERAQIDQFNLSRDHLHTVAGDRMALVDATVVNRVVRADGSVRGRLMALELRAPDYGPVEGSGHWVLVRLATGEQPTVTIPAGTAAINAPDVLAIRERVLGI
jgi:hypothetical protein